MQKINILKVLGQVVATTAVAVAVAAGCGADGAEPDTQEEELDALVDDWQTTDRLVAPNSTAREMSYCETLTHWRNNPQDFLGDSDLYGFMLDVGCTHCWNCARTDAAELEFPLLDVDAADEDDAEAPPVDYERPMTLKNPDGSYSMESVGCGLVFFCGEDGRPHGNYYGDCDAGTRIMLADFATDLCGGVLQ